MDKLDLSVTFQGSLWKQIKMVDSGKNEVNILIASPSFLYDRVPVPGKFESF